MTSAKCWAIHSSEEGTPIHLESLHILDSDAALHIIPSEEEFLEDGRVPGTYRQHEMRGKVMEKVEDLPALVEIVVKEIDHFAGENAQDRDYLDSDEGRRAWLELMGVGEDASLNEAEAIMDLDTSREPTGPTNLGIELGTAIRRLMYWPKEAKIQREEVIADLMYGFLRGLYVNDQPAGAAEAVVEDTNDILEGVQARADAHVERMDVSPLLESSEREAHRWEMTRNMAARVETLLGDDLPQEELGPSFTLGRDRHSEGRPHPFALEVVDHLMSVSVGGDHPLRSAGAYTAFWNQHGPADDFDPEEFVTEEKVWEVIEDRKLFERYALLSQLEDDGQRLAWKGNQGVAAHEVLPLLVDEGAQSSAEIAETINDSKDRTAAVTRLAKDLAGQDCEDRADGIEVWTERPLLEGDTDGWEVTRYGEAATHAMKRCLAERESMVQPIQLSPFPEELVDAALTNTGTDEQE